ncbi:MAG: response regulator [Bacillota bacterium]
MAKKVLVVDDAMFMRKMISDILKTSDYEVVAEASDGKEAYVKYKNNEPDLVTMDITMSPVNGIDGVKKIMSDYPDAKILMVSAMGQQQMVVDAINAGAKGFIVKPFDKEKVLKEISKIL